MVAEVDTTLMIPFVEEDMIEAAVFMLVQQIHLRSMQITSGASLEGEEFDF